jgi:hypothetical protein
MLAGENGTVGNIEKTEKVFLRLVFNKLNVVSGAGFMLADKRSAAGRGRMPRAPGAMIHGRVKMPPALPRAVKGLFSITNS